MQFDQFVSFTSGNIRLHAGWDQPVKRIFYCFFENVYFFVQIVLTVEKKINFFRETSHDHVPLRSSRKRHYLTRPEKKSILFFEPLKKMLKASLPWLRARALLSSERRAVATACPKITERGTRFHPNNPKF